MNKSDACGIYRKCTCLLMVPACSKHMSAVHPFAGTTVAHSSYIFLLTLMLLHPIPACLCHRRLHAVSGLALILHS